MTPKEICLARHRNPCPFPLLLPRAPALDFPDCRSCRLSMEMRDLKIRRHGICLEEIPVEKNCGLSQFRDIDKRILSQVAQLLHHVWCKMQGTASAGVQ